MFKLLEINDIIDIHKGIPAVVEAHGPTADINRSKINELHANKEIILFGINEWWAFEQHPRPDYWVRAHTGANGGHVIEKDFDYFNKWTGGEIPLLNCDTTERTSLETAKKVLDCPYLPYDNRHFNGKSCSENYDTLEWFTPIDKTFFPDCCNRIGRLTIQEEFQKYTNYEELMSASSFTGSVYMLTFAVLMGCNPIYINGMDLDYFGEGGVYAKLNENNPFPRFSPGPQTWTGWRRDWMMRDFIIINESAKNIGVEVLNLNHDTWYRVFKGGNL